jgi:hypothetical protein
MAYRIRRRLCGATVPGWLLCFLAVADAACARQARTPGGSTPPAASAAAKTPQPNPELAALRDEVARLKRLVPSQSHAMQDVAYHFTNLWFAGQKRNWPLAAFYLDETRSHLKWAVRIIPVRKAQAGPVDLEGIREAVDSSTLTLIEQAIQAKDAARFAAAYKLSLEGCYSCHKASEKPYLRPQVPTQPEVHIINFDPTAGWPQ